MARVTLLLLSLMMMEAQSKPTQMELPEMKEIGNIDDVVQTVSRLARSFEGPQDGSSINVRIPRQIGGPPLGPPGPYRYGYAVQDDIGNDFNKQETSDGGVVTGQYSVLLPDGRIQTVTYSVAPNTGFVAEVTYS